MDNTKTQTIGQLRDPNCKKCYGTGHRGVIIQPDGTKVVNVCPCVDKQFRKLQAKTNDQNSTL